MAIPQRKVYKKIQVRSDIEIHVYRRRVDNVDFYDVREFVVSLDQYGRGITFPGDVFDDVWTGLEAAYADKS